MFFAEYKKHKTHYIRYKRRVVKKPPGLKYIKKMCGGYAVRYYGSVELPPYKIEYGVRESNHYK